MPYDINVAPSEKDGSLLSTIENDTRIALGAISFVENTLGALAAKARRVEALNGPSELTEMVTLAKQPWSTIMSQSAYHLTRAVANTVLARREHLKYRHEIAQRMRLLPWDMPGTSDMVPVLTEAAAAEKREEVMQRSVLALAKPAQQQPRQQKRKWTAPDAQAKKHKPAEKPKAAETTAKPKTTSTESYREYKGASSRGSGRGRGGRGRGRGRGAGHKGGNATKKEL
jgi:hypothetical protein